MGELAVLLRDYGPSGIRKWKVYERAYLFPPLDGFEGYVHDEAWRPVEGVVVALDWAWAATDSRGYYRVLVPCPLVPGRPHVLSYRKGGLRNAQAWLFGARHAVVRQDCMLVG
jgi:hypothetical protein